MNVTPEQWDAMVDKNIEAKAEIKQLKSQLAAYAWTPVEPKQSQEKQRSNNEKVLQKDMQAN